MTFRWRHIPLAAALLVGTIASGIATAISLLRLGQMRSAR